MFILPRVGGTAPISLSQAHLADMVVDLDAARLLVLRAAYLKDTGGGKVTTEVSIAKL